VFNYFSPENSGIFLPLGVQNAHGNSFVITVKGLPVNGLYVN
jgi:hypothetical protein